uniref:Major facilitator superfamily (MFS) profile domain-containing protein n=1 Tax=Bionectria ochroleuca TaxID=29856 RepID=A0A8H7N6P1_BIOOC
MDPRTVEETAPLLGAEVVTTDPRTIEEREFAKGDPENPLEWPLKFKWLFISILFFMGATVTFTCISPVPIAGRIVQDLSNGQKNKYASVLLVTIWELGEAAGPLLIAPSPRRLAGIPSLMSVASSSPPRLFWLRRHRPRRSSSFLGFCPAYSSRQTSSDRRLSATFSSPTCEDPP